METLQTKPTTPWVKTDFIDEDIKELFKNQGVYMANDPLIAQHIKLLRGSMTIDILKKEILNGSLVRHYPIVMSPEQHGWNEAMTAVLNFIGKYELDQDNK